MAVLLKHTLRNIFARPFRTILLVFCISVCAFAALLCMDMSGSIEYLVKNTLAQFTGTADLIVTDELGLDEDSLALPMPCDILKVAEKTTGYIEIPEGFYTYFHTREYTVETFDFETAYRMRLLKEKESPAEDEAYLSAKLAEACGWAAGDEILLYSDTGDAVQYKVKGILEESGIANGIEFICLSKEGFLRLDYDGKIEYAYAYVDVLDDGDIGEAAACITANDYRAEIQNLATQDGLDEMIRLITLIFLLIFAVCFLLVIFVTMSVSQRVISERMAVVGTFRSLGISNRATVCLLFAESGLYGLLGGIFGCLIYGIARNAIFSGFVSVDAGEASVTLDYGNTGAEVYLAILLGAVVVECLCSLKEVIRASHTSIRDIIFDNKDTKYRMNPAAVCAGGLLLLLSVPAIRSTDRLPVLFFGFGAIVFGASMVFPLVLKGCARGLAFLFERGNMPVARLAAMEISERKSTVGAAVLCVTASTLAAVLFCFVTSLDAIYEIQTYDCDLIVDVGGREKAAMYAYIPDMEGVADSEMIYGTSKSIRIEGQASAAREVNIFGLPEEGYRMFTGIRGLPDGMEKDVFYMDQRLAEALQIAVGQEAELVFDTESYMPVTKALTLAGYLDSYEYDTTANSIVIDRGLYVDIFHDKPGMILIRLEEREGESREAGLERIRQNLEKYSGGLIGQIRTGEEYREGWQKKKQGMNRLLLAVILLGVGLTVVGMISSQLIGFEGRKRECAVLASTAMSRASIARMLVAESMLSSGVALGMAFLLAFPAFIPFRKILEVTAGEIRTAYDAGKYAFFLAVLWGVYTLVALFPVRHLKKMNLAMQLKYE